jgi:hypothetical protein
VGLLEEEDALPLANQFDKASDKDGVLLDVSLELDPVNTIPNKLINKEWPLLLVNNLSLLQGLVVTCREPLRDCNQQFAKDFWEVLLAGGIGGGVDVLTWMEQAEACIGHLQKFAQTAGGYRHRRC